METKLVEEIRRREPGVDYIGIFGSRARGMHFLDSDVDLILSGNISLDKEDLRELVEENYEAPRADVYVLGRKYIEHPSINPKTSTMGLDIQELYRSEGFREIRFDKDAIDPKSFCAFLEYERLRNLEIFSGKDLTLDYLKKMPGGRRSYDEISWLSKLGNLEYYLDENLQQHLHNLRRRTVDKTLGDSIAHSSNELDKKILDLESELVPDLNSFQHRGHQILECLSPEAGLARSSSEEEAIDIIYERHKVLSSAASWLIIYATSFNPHIGVETADKIASINQKEVFDVELKKSLLQNRSIREDKFGRVLLKLEEDRDSLIRTYARIVRNPDYLETLPANTRRFLKENTNHLT